MSRPTAIVCGLNPDGTEPLAREPEQWEPPRCDEALWLTHGPLASLWCPVHGHVLDVPPDPPLTGTVFLTTAEGCIKAELSEL